MSSANDSVGRYLKRGSFIAPDRDDPLRAVGLCLGELMKIKDLPLIPPVTAQRYTTVVVTGHYFAQINRERERERERAGERRKLTAVEGSTLTSLVKRRGDHAKPMATDSAAPLRSRTIIVQ